MGNLVVVGGGIGYSLVLHNLMKKIQENKNNIANIPGLLSEIHVVTKETDSTAWGKNNSPSPLTIGHFNLVASDETIRDIEDFIKANRKKLKQLCLAEGQIKDKNFAKLYFDGLTDDEKDFWNSKNKIVPKQYPRRCVGEYFRVMQEEAEKFFKEQGVRIRKTIATVGHGGYETKDNKIMVTAKTPEGKTIRISGDNVIVAMGIGIRDDLRKKDDQKFLGYNPRYFSEMYQHSCQHGKPISKFELLIQQILQLRSLQLSSLPNTKPEPVNISIVGLGPASLDVLKYLHYQCLYDPKFKDKINITLFGHKNNKHWNEASEAQLKGYQDFFGEGLKIKDSKVIENSVVMQKSAVIQKNQIVFSISENTSLATDILVQCGSSHVNIPPSTTPNIKHLKFLSAAEFIDGYQKDAEEYAQDFTSQMLQNQKDTKTSAFNSKINVATHTVTTNKNVQPSIAAISKNNSSDKKVSNTFTLLVPVTGRVKTINDAVKNFAERENSKKTSKFPGL